MTDLDHARQICADITLRKGPNFSVGFRALPKEKRDAVYASYAFCRLVDDLVDEEGDRGPDALMAALNRWRQELREVYHGAPTHPVAVSLADAVHRYPIPHGAFEELIQGCEEDLSFQVPSGLAQLERYCDLVATPIGTISLAIFGVIHDDAPRLGRHLSHALQLTNILRDVREDALRGRVYFPQTWLDEAGVSSSDFVADRSSAGFLILMERGVALAREHYHAAAPLAAMVERDAQRAVQLMGGVYVEILARIAADPERVLKERVGLSDQEKRELAEAC